MKYRTHPYWVNILIGLDQSIGTWFGIDADLTISGFVGWRYPDTWVERAINWLFQDDSHCKDSIEWDVISRIERNA